MKNWSKILLMTLLGGVIGFFIPANRMVDNWLLFVSNIIIQMLIYFSIIYVGVKTYKGFTNIKSIKGGFGRNFILFFAFMFLSYVLAIIFSLFLVNMNIFNLNESLVINQVVQNKMDLPEFKDIISAIVESNIFTVFTGKTRFFLPVILISIIIGYAAYQVKKKAEYFTYFIDSLDAILEKITSYVFEAFSILSVFIFISLARNSRLQDTNTVAVLKIIFTTLIVAIVMFLVFGLFYIIIFRKKLSKIFISLLTIGGTAFATGNTAAALIPLNKQLKHNLGIDEDLIDSMSSLSLILNRVGTIITTIIVLSMIVFNYSESIFSLKVQFLISLFTIIFAFRLDGVHQAGFLVLAAMVQKVSTLPFDENSYLNFYIFVPILSRVAVFFDVIFTGFFILLSAEITGNVKKVEYKDFI